MKELTTYNRVAGYLNKVFDQLNVEFFESALTKLRVQRKGPARCNVLGLLPVISTRFCQRLRVLLHGVGTYRQ